jgi:hypothetical protein
MKPFKTRSKPMLKNIAASWYGEIDLKILKEKPMGHKFFEKERKKFISKGLLRTRSNCNPSKVHNHHLVKVSQNKISQLSLLFHSSTFVS